MDWRSIGQAQTDGVTISVLGGSLKESLLPAILTAGMERRGVVVPLEVDAHDFEECVRHLESCGYRGASIAHPHKTAAARLAQRFFTVKHAMGVANALIFESGIWGQNNEVAAIQSLFGKVEPGNALVLGAGSGARSVVVALLDAGWKVRLWNRNGMRSRLLQTTIKAYGEVDLVPSVDPTGCGLIVNATTVGKRAGEKLPVEWSHVRRGTTVMDLVYRRVPTELLREAALRGLPTVDGRRIVVEKAALSLEWWLGQPANRDAMSEAAGLRVLR